LRAHSVRRGVFGIAVSCVTVVLCILDCIELSSFWMVFGKVINYL